MNAHIVTRMFEERMAEYTGAPYAVAVDSCTNALFLSLMYVGIKDVTIFIPNRTYMSVPCVVRQAGGQVHFYDIKRPTLKGSYGLFPTRVIDSALRLTSGMYIPHTFTCLSFTGSRKHLKLGKGGMILTDNEEAYKWFKKARFSGRNEISYHEDNFDMLGWNCWMLPDVAARGLLLMQDFPLYNEDLDLPYPDLSKFPVYTTI